MLYKGCRQSRVNHPAEQGGINVRESRMNIAHLHYSQLESVCFGFSSGIGKCINAQRHTKLGTSPSMMRTPSKSNRVFYHDKMLINFILLISAKGKAQRQFLGGLSSRKVHNTLDLWYNSSGCPLTFNILPVLRTFLHRNFSEKFC